MTPDELEEFLKGRPEETRHQEAIWIASRAAARVMPNAMQDGPGSRSFDLTALRILRCLLISRVAAKMPTREIIEAAATTTTATFAADAATAILATATATGTATAATAAAAAYAATAATTTATFAADAATFAADAATFAAEAATTTTAATAATFAADAAAVVNGEWKITPLPLWPDTEAPEPIQLWEQVKPKLPRPGVGYGPDTARGEPLDDWGFWIDWYDSWLEGKPFDLELQKKVALIPDEDWKHEDNPGHINLIIRDIYKVHKAKPISQAATVDFEAEPQGRWMEMRPFLKDLEHLNTPEAVRGFVNDCEDLKERFEVFLDFARDEAPQGANASGPCVKGVSVIVRVLSQAEKRDRMNSALLVDMGHTIEAGLEIAAEREAIKEPNAEMLDMIMDDFHEIVRKHLMPGEVRRAGLRDFELGDHDPTQLVNDIDKAIKTLRTPEISGLLPPDPEAEEAFRSFVDGLDNLRTQILDTSSEDRRINLSKRFARAYAATVATMKRYVEKAAPYADKTNEIADKAIKNHGRWTKLAELVKWVADLIP